MSGTAIGNHMSPVSLNKDVNFFYGIGIRCGNSLNFMNTAVAITGGDVVAIMPRFKSVIIDFEVGKMRLYYLIGRKCYTPNYG
jgi:hypothetical protein